MAYVAPKFKDKHGKTYHGNKAWEKGLKKSSDMGVLAIPNRPFSGKPIKIILGKNPPDGDYRKPLTVVELGLLQQVVPDLSIRVIDSKPELSDPRMELFLRRYYHMRDSRIRTLTWANIFDACRDYMATKKEDTEQGESNNGHEINPETREQAWRDEYPEYVSNSNAVRMGNGKISITTLSKILRKPGNTIRWMRNEKSRRSKVHAQDFNEYMKILKSVNDFTEAALKQQQERKEEIASNKQKTGK